MARLTRPRAGRPVKMFVSTVAGRSGDRRASRWAAEVVASSAHRKALPTWTPDAAAGTFWTSASDAASGAQPSGWGVPGSASGWHPVSRPALDAGEQGPPSEPEDPTNPA